MRNGITVSIEQLNIGQRRMLAAGPLAAGGFALVSIVANLRFGVSLATTQIDRIIYGTPAIAADLACRASAQFALAGVFTRPRLMAVFQC